MACVSGPQASYLQIRGSVPLFWRQIINLKYKPLLEADADDASVRPAPATGTAAITTENAHTLPSPDGRDQQQAFAAHFQELFSLYGDQIVFSLIDGKGYETKVGSAFDAVVKRADDRRIRYRLHLAGPHLTGPHPTRPLPWAVPKPRF